MRRYSHGRSQRIADQIQKDVVDILRQKVRDPRIVWVTINDVEVTDDNTWAKIYWTVLQEEKRDEVTKALDSAKTFIRSELSKGFRTYTIPQLKFIYDESMMRGTNMLNVLNKVKGEFSDDEDEDIQPQE
jgi:ribosome-binding factor A